MSNELEQLASLANSVRIDDELSSAKEWRSRGDSMFGNNDAIDYHEHEEEVEEDSEVFEALPPNHKEKKPRRTPSDITAKSLITTIDGLTQLGRPWINSKFKKKISEADWDRVYDLQEEDSSHITPDDLKLLERVNRLKAEASEFAEQLRFDDKDYKDLMQATELMVEETGFDMPPTAPFFLEIIKKLGERVIMISTI